MRIHKILFMLFVLVSAQASAQATMWSGNEGEVNVPNLDSTHRIRKVHMDELRAAVNAARVNSNCGLLPQAFTTPTINPGSPIRISHITELRAAINTVYVAAGQPPYAFTDPAVAAGDVIRSEHINDLREAVDNAPVCAPVCGNGGAPEAGEQCDDGNTANGDGCSSTCQTEGGPIGACGEAICYRCEAGGVCRIDLSGPFNASACLQDCTAAATPCGAPQCYSCDTACIQDSSGTFPNSDCNLSCGTCNNDGTCNPGMGESHVNCPGDCSCNNNSSCEPGWGENCTSCPSDCGSTCNANGICDPSACENSVTCPADCNTVDTCVGQPAGHICRMSSGSCDPSEVCDGLIANCPGDVNSCQPNPCDNDGVCELDESFANCAGDCHCGNSICDFFETNLTCPGDCAANTCTNGSQDGDETGVDCGGSCPNSCGGGGGGFNTMCSGPGSWIGGACLANTVNCGQGSTGCEDHGTYACCGDDPNSPVGCTPTYQTCKYS